MCDKNYELDLGPEVVHSSYYRALLVVCKDASDRALARLRPGPPTATGVKPRRGAKSEVRRT